MTKVWAHRGASGYAPENTMEAFRLAAQQKADGIELDVQMTKDKELVITHDERIDRVTGVHGWVKDFSLEELRRLRFNRTHPEYKEAVIPTLEEVLRFVKEQTLMTVNIELKTGIVFYPDIERRTMELVRNTGMEDRVIYSSFNHYSMVKIKELDPSAKAGLLYEDGFIDVPDYAKRHGMDALHPALYNIQYPDFVRQCRERGLKIHTWTVNEEEYMRMVFDLKLDALITNYPDVALRLRDQRG